MLKNVMKNEQKSYRLETPISPSIFVLISSSHSLPFFHPIFASAGPKSQSKSDRFPCLANSAHANISPLIFSTNFFYSTYKNP